MESLSLGFTGVIFFIVVGIKPSYLITCGTLNFENHKVMECQTARLIYTPNKEQTHEMRKWVREINSTSSKVIYNYKTSNDESKYFESKQGESFILYIPAVNSADAGDYLVHCGGRHYTRRSNLGVSVNTNGCPERCGKLSTTNSYVIEGDPVTFQFSVDPGKDITWEKKVETTYTQLKDQKYIIRVVQEKKVHSLDILETEYSNSGEYRVNCGDTVSNSIYLNIVYSHPSNPVFSNVVSKFYCNNKECILATLNKSVTVECYVEGGSKPIELNMLKDGAKLTNTNKNSNDINTITYNYIRYSFIPTMSDINAMFTCTVNNPAIQEPLATSIMLYTIVPPTSIEVNVNELIEGIQGEVQCIAKNGRPPLKSDINIGSKQETNTTKTVDKVSANLYTITMSVTKNFTRIHNQEKVLCCNNIGETTCEDKNLNVLFPPKNVIVEEIFKRNEENGDTVITLKFIAAESNPRSSIDLSGLKHVQRKMVDNRNDPDNETHGWIYTAVWSFNFTKDDDKREIKYEVQNDGFPDLELSNIYTLNITYYPIVTISENEHKTVYLGEDVDLTCDVDSNPLSTLSWHNQTAVIDEIFGAKRIELHLTNVSTDHSQTYSCKAQNGIGGIVSRNITLTVKDPSERPVTEAIKPSAESNIASVVGPIIGCLLCAILIAVIVVLIIRKKRQNEPSNKRNIHETKIEEIKPLHPTGKDTEMQAGYESLAGQDTTTEIEMYTDLDDDMQARNESLAGQGTNTEKGMYTNLDTEMHPGYESLAGQGFTSEIEMYTNLEGPTSTELPSEYEHSEL
ncbi:nephrin-like isoform X3 [Ruditapes philippinarum]|uniref:nephrin-like isoform X3 n=1 Tax=Ruditapes philippinarum TaxID=129788 RepID=UPI00295B86A8|nr:nephrin-like isoform X3 [Ruditapes philippinarum]